MIFEPNPKYGKILFAAFAVILLGGIAYLAWSARTGKSADKADDTLPAKEDFSGKEPDMGNFSFQYPETLSAKHISTQEWPPAIAIKDGVYSCAKTPLEKSSQMDMTGQRVINGRIYCVNVSNSAAAGSAYSSYNYTTPLNGKLVSLSFTLRYPNCGNYEQIQSRECASEREAFNLDAIVDEMVRTIRWDEPRQDGNLAVQLAECLPRSDGASHEKCLRLLGQIKDFDDCVMAGFSIMKSNPPQCATPDGRTFTQQSR